jgi:hypothetical protein
MSSPVFNEVVVICRDSPTAMKRISMNIKFYEYVFSKYPDKYPKKNFTNIDDINKWLTNSNYDSLDNPELESLKEKADRYQIYFRNNHKHENFSEWIEKIQNDVIIECKCSHIQNIKKRIEDVKKFKEWNDILWPAMLYDMTIMEVPGLTIK